jgi:selenide,water dikinase
MQANWPIVKDLVLVGGGHAHALVLRMWAMDPLPGVRVTLVSPDPVAPYTGMLPGLVAGLYRRDEVMVDLVRLCAFSGARFIMARATGLAGGQVLTDVAGPVAYDVLSVDVGGMAVVPDVPGLDGIAVAARPLGVFAARWQGFVQAAGPEPAVAVIGAGAGGAELALAAVHRLRGAGRRPRVALLDRGGGPLPGLSRAARRRMLVALQAAGINLMTGVTVARATAAALHLADGRVVPADLAVLAAGVRAPGWLADTGLALHDGWLRVGPTLQTSDPAVFAAGDCAHLSHAPRPRAGVFAVRAAPVLLHNLRAALAGGRMRDFRPQRDFLRLLSLGDGRAVADWRGMAAAGGWVWRWKDGIDRRFMSRLSDLRPMRPAMPRAMAEGLRDMLADRPLCGGCGSKVGAGTLAEALRALPAPVRADVVAGAGDDAAVLRAGAALQVVTTDHLRAVTQDEALMARIAAHHALGDVLAMGAAPQVALSQVMLPAASPAIQARMLARIQHAAAGAMGQAGAEVVGGHTTAGAELVLGFAVTGTLAPDALRRKGGARPGDVLVLTRPLGSGTVLAALMAQAPTPGALLGEHVAAALAMMARPPGPAARVLAPHATAMTDVTGFGLAGHLLEICEASGTGAEIDLASVPVLPGALELASRGERSSLAPANRAAALGRVAGAEGAAGALLFDPQTCGGFLAAVPPGVADRVLAELRALGEAAARIGTMTAGEGGVRVQATEP